MVLNQPLPSGKALLAFGGQPSFDKPDTLTLTLPARLAS